MNVNRGLVCESGVTLDEGDKYSRIFYFTSVTAAWHGARLANDRWTLLLLQKFCIILFGVFTNFGMRFLYCR